VSAREVEQSRKEHITGDSRKRVHVEVPDGAGRRTESLTVCSLDGDDGGGGRRSGGGGGGVRIRSSVAVVGAGVRLRMGMGVRM